MPRRSVNAAEDSRNISSNTGSGHTPYDDLLALIVRGRLPPGARVAEGPLADWLGVSRTPVREALQRLRHQRLLVEVGGGAGVRVRLAVAPLERDQVEELYGLTGALESFAVRGVAAWSEPQRDRLARQLEKIERSFAKESKKTPVDYDRLFELHDAFHTELTRGIIGPETAALLETTRPHRDRYEWFYAPLIGPDFTATRIEHGEIVEALREGTTRRLQRAVQANWENAAARLAPMIEEYDTRIRFSGLPLSLARDNERDS